MKTNLKRLVLYAALLISANVTLYAQQTPPTWYTPAWDWQNELNTNWNAWISGHKQGMTTPFISNNSPEELNNIIFASDYKPEQGWVLLFKDFGYADTINPNNSGNVAADLPLFFLYNKYTGTLRCYFYSSNSGNPLHNSAVCKLSWSIPIDTAMNNSLLTFENNFPRVNDAYPKTNNGEAFFNYVKYPNSSGWFSTDFKMNFDPATYRSTLGQEIVFSFQLGDISTVSLSGGITFTTQTATAQEQPVNGTTSTNSSNTTFENFNVQAKKFLGKVPTKAAVSSVFTQIEKNVDTLDGKYCTNFTRDLHNLNNSLQSGALKSFLLGAAGFVPQINTGLSVLSTVMDLFSSKSNTAAANVSNVSVAPTISHGQIALSGSITTLYSGRQLFMQLPGTKHKNGNFTFYPGIPHYDCPLGVISLKRLPAIKQRMYNAISAGQQTAVSELDCPGTGSPLYVAATSSTYGPVYSQYETTNSANGHRILHRSLAQSTNIAVPMVSYQLDDLVELDHNLASGTSLASAKVALMFEILPSASNTLQPSIKPGDAHSAGFAPWAFDGLQADLWPELGNAPEIYTEWPVNRSETYVNATGRNLNAGVLKLSSYDSLTKRHKFQTPFVDLDKAKGLAATFQGGAVKVYLKLQLVLKPTDPAHDQTPITQVLTYEVPNPTADNSAGSAYPLICAQLQEMEPDSYLSQNACSGAGSSTLTGNLNGVYITNFCDATLNPHLAAPDGSATWKADHLVKLSPPFKTTLAGADLFRAHIAPTGLCANGANALQVNAHFADCNPNPASYRPAAPVNDTGATAPGLEKKASATGSALCMRVVPNPNNGTFRLAFNAPHAAGSLTITDNLNRPVWQGKIGENTEPALNISESLAPGIYFIIFTDNQGLLFTQKLLKQ